MNKRMHFGKNIKRIHDLEVKYTMSNGVGTEYKYRLRVPDFTMNRVRALNWCRSQGYQLTSFKQV